MEEEEEEEEEEGFFLVFLDLPSLGFLLQFLES